MGEIKEWLVFLIPLVAVQLALLAYTLRHILTHDTYRRGTRGMWLLITLLLMNYVGPILYFAFGREDE